LNDLLTKKCALFKGNYAGTCTSTCKKVTRVFEANTFLPVAVV
jgi:hypothetical protein